MGSLTVRYIDAPPSDAQPSSGVERSSASYLELVSELEDKLPALEQAEAVFSQTRVPYALIGGLAVGIRSGVPRATLDCDFAVATSVDREWLSARFVAVGFQLKGRAAHTVHFLHGSGEPVRLIFDAGFDPMIERAELLQLGDIELRVVTRDDLLAMKRRAADDPERCRSKSLRDQADVVLLEGDTRESAYVW